MGIGINSLRYITPLIEGTGLYFIKNRKRNKDNSKNKKKFVSRNKDNNKNKKTFVSRNKDKYENKKKLVSRNNRLRVLNY